MPGDPLLDPPAWAPAWIPSIEDTARIRVLRWVIRGVLVAGLGGCVLRGASVPADPVLGPPIEAAAVCAVPAGPLASEYGTIRVDLRSPAGETISTCMLDADTPEERGKGLMFVTDPELEGYDGMLFRYDTPTEGQFYMYNTELPLRVAWYDQNGAWVAAADMVPCESETPDACPRYPSPAPFLYGIELTTSSPLNPVVLEGSSITVGG